MSLFGLFSDFRGLSLSEQRGKLVLSKATGVTTKYALRWTYDYTNFFDKVDFPATSDIYNNGFAEYVTKDAALASGLAKVAGRKVYLGVDAQNTYSEDSAGRHSVRIQSKDVFDNGLLVADFAHLPEAGNGMWPA
ncbi:hypothetical protein PMIN07_000550 [Paraphaeosphaeria minitans]